MSRPEEGLQLPERPRTPPDPERRGPSEIEVDPEAPADDNAPADERVEVVKEPPGRRG